MGGYILKRLLLMVPTLFGVMLITFAITQFVPGGPVERLVAQLSGYGAGGDTTSGGLYQGNKGLDQERVEQLKKLYGFDRPPLTRFLTMMRQYLVFDFGHSYYHHRSVSELVVSKLPVSMSLGLWTFVIVYSVCIPLGIAKAVRDGSAFDVATSTLILVGLGAAQLVEDVGAFGFRVHLEAHRGGLVTAAGEREQHGPAERQQAGPGAAEGRAHGCLRGLSSTKMGWAWAWAASRDSCRVFTQNEVMSSR